jgi:hypothetical protein
VLSRLALGGAEAVALDDQASAALLDDPQVCRGLPLPVADADGLALIESLRSAAPHDPAAEARIAGAFNLLKARAARAIPELPAYPTSAALDEIETALRWAALLKRRLVSWALPAALGSVEQFLGRRLEQLPTEEMLATLRRAVQVASESVEAVDPQRRRLSQRCAYAMSRALAAGPRPAASRAGTRHRPGTVVLVRPFERLCPWQRWLDLPAAQRARVDRLEEPLREIVCRRFGLQGERPLSLALLAAESARTPAAVARRVARALEALR